MSAQELDRILEKMAAGAAEPKGPFSVQGARDTWYIEHGLDGLTPELRQRTETIGAMEAEWIGRDDAKPDRVILYLHGGGYICGSIASHRPMTFELARTFDGQVLSINYRLSPEHPFPAPVDDAISAYDHLLALGFSPANIAVGGDSAAGGLAVGMMLKLRDEGRPLPGAALIVSPWSDLPLTGETLHTRADGDPIVFLESLQVCAQVYMGESRLPAPYASPADADLTGLPPILIQVGSKEILLDDAIKLARTAALANVDVSLRIWPGMPHVWHLLSPDLEEGREGCAEATAWLNSRLGAG